MNKNYKSTANWEILLNFQKFINQSTGKNYSKFDTNLFEYTYLYFYMYICIYAHTYRAMHQI